MFERFTDNARRVVVGAQEEARERGADAIRTEHVLASLYTVPDSLAVTVLAGHGVDGTVVDAAVGPVGASGSTPRRRRRSSSR